MVLTNVRQFASELGLTPERLQEQLRAAGVAERAPDETLSEQDKSRLLDYLKRSHGARDENSITVTRKQTSEIRTAAGTVRVETRKKRVVIRPDEAVSAPAAAVSAPVAAPLAAPVAAPAPEAVQANIKQAETPAPAAKSEVAPAVAEVPPAAVVKAPVETPPVVEAKPPVEAKAVTPAAPEVKEAAPVERPRVVRPGPASILSPEETALRESEERRQVQFRERQAALMREKIEREERRAAAARQAQIAAQSAPVVVKAVEETAAAPEVRRGEAPRPARPNGQTIEILLKQKRSW